MGSAEVGDHLLVYRVPVLGDVSLSGHEFLCLLQRFNSFSKPLGGSKSCLVRLSGRFGALLWDSGYLVWEFGFVDMGTW